MKVLVTGSAGLPGRDVLRLLENRGIPCRGVDAPEFDPADVVITMTGKSGSVCFYRDGCVQAFDEDKALEILSEHDVHFDCDMNMGSEEATAWGCDLTYDYVKINGDYRT